MFWSVFCVLLLANVLVSTVEARCTDVGGTDYCQKFKQEGGCDSTRACKWQFFRKKVKIDLFRRIKGAPLVLGIFAKQCCGPCSAFSYPSTSLFPMRRRSEAAASSLTSWMSVPMTEVVISASNFGDKGAVPVGILSREGLLRQSAGSRVATARVPKAPLLLSRYRFFCNFSSG
ncbi:hypothetical protein Q1695_005803 [Nippostrongylus brasiliensis]|nr:hypothetical protein Q1695_005803 [Nippostrongylus brasiliensis]